MLAPFQHFSIQDIIILNDQVLVFEKFANNPHPQIKKTFQARINIYEIEKQKT